MIDFNALNNKTIIVTESPSEIVFGTAIQLLNFNSKIISSVTRFLLSELSHYNIRIKAISLGTIYTSFHQRYSSKEKLEVSKNITLIKRLYNSEDCFGSIIFLCMISLSFYIAGQVLEINVGQFFL